MAEQHQKSHADGNKAKDCESRYWAWLEEQCPTAAGSEPLDKVVACEFLSPE